MSKKIAFKTLGCRLNQFETDSLASQFQQKGYTIVDDQDQADVVIVNTCTVTNQSDQKSRSTINQSARKHENAVMVVTGCMVESGKEKLKQNENVGIVVDNNHKSSIFQIVDDHFKGIQTDIEKLDADLFSYDAAKDTFHTRSMIKIQDGCDNFCTYCIIPAVRGAATSRAAEDILENIRKVIDFGFKEVVLTGVNIGRYDHDGVNFEDLLERVLELPGDFRVRISSIEPDGFGDRFFELVNHPKLTPHLHLCLQSGSEKILLAMRRMHTAKVFKQFIDKVRAIRPDFNFTTDLIVGFPGETEKDHQDSMTVATDINFGHIHTFKYSKRQGTRAERMPDQVHGKIMTERSEEIRVLGENLKRNYRESFIGKAQRVLVEKIREDGFAYGYGENYVPVKFKGVDLQKNEFYPVKIYAIESGDDPDLIGEVMK
ncbi:MAG: tRNA (N(6)-L-threonylcarbamoyladenosine(37)-C(2))-methylthiotransferase MtaB [Bacteroidales bacterium]|nr:tRNA (N(6)-L-threonylcarbamoyladenosine(37)-C(2))-methylthiotransferase MtaB [Bacteroidales bacterium]